MPNLDPPNCSFKVDATKQKGRHVKATKACTPSEVFYSDEPLVHVAVSQEYCAYCLRRFNGDSKNVDVDQLRRCQGCNKEFYCSKKCLVEAWREYHWLECNMYSCFLDPVNDRLALRLLLKSAKHGIPIIGIEREYRQSMHENYPPSLVGLMMKHAGNSERHALQLIQMFDNTRNPRVTVSRNARRLAALVAQAITCFCKNKGQPGDMLKTYKLSRSDFIFESCGIRDIEYFQYYKRTAFTIERMKETTTKFDDKSELQIQLYGLFLDLLHMVHKNAATMSRSHVSGATEKNSGRPSQPRSKLETDERHQISLVIYPKVSMLNHSCKPNAFLAFGPFGKVQVKATEVVHPGDEINISYGPMATRAFAHVRQEFLRERYGFHCECVACSKSSQVRAEMEKMLHLASTYKCQACEGPMLEIGHSCTHCNADIDINLIRAKMRKVTGVMKNAAMHAGKPLPYFKEALDIGKEIFFEMHDMLIDIRDKLAHSSARNDDFETAAELVFENYKTICPRYGKDSIEAANELIKLASLWTHIPGKENKGLTACRHAQTVLSIYEYDFKAALS